MNSGDSLLQEWFSSYINIPDNIAEGQVINIGDKEFVIRDGVIRDRMIHSSAQQQTEDTFAFKWKRRESYDEHAMEETTRRWLVERYGDLSQGEWRNGLEADKPIFLDAGCGACFSTLALFGDQLANVRYIGADISEAVDVGQKRFSERGYDGAFIQCDLIQLPLPPSSVDVVYSEGVLHHTDSTENAIKYMADLLKPSGMFFFYVYRKKGPIREFTDDYIREKIQEMEPGQAWSELESLTKLGGALGKLNVTVDVPEAVDLLEIPKGPIDLQRLFYWHVFKAFYRPDWTLEEMNHVNFDWFAPKNCHRQSLEQVQAWCEEANLSILREVEEYAGITIIARKRA